jgi:hypothetical protein
LPDGASRRATADYHIDVELTPPMAIWELNILVRGMNFFA